MLSSERTSKNIPIIFSFRRRTQDEAIKTYRFPSPSGEGKDEVIKTKFLEVLIK